MVHLRLIVPSALTHAVVEHLRMTPGVAHVVHLSCVSTEPAGDLVLCDVVREAANDVIEWLRHLGIHREGAITVEALEAVVSDAADAAEIRAPGHGGDALIWEELEERARYDAALTVSYLVFIGIAGLIAAVGILLDSPILIIGAMVVGPEYGALSALCVGVARRRPRPAWHATRTLLIGLLLAAVVALLGTLFFVATGLAPDTYDVSARELTAFISQPDGLAVVVAILAGVVGTLSYTEGRSGALIGVLVSATTLPAVANVGVATAYGEWNEVAGAALQLGINVTALVVAGLATLVVQARGTTHVPGHEPAHARRHQVGK